MKRFGPVLLLVLACTGNPTAPTIPSAPLKRAPSQCAILNTYRGDGYETQVGPTWRWHIQGSFGTSCGGVMRVTLFFIDLDDNRKIFGSGWTVGNDPQTFEIEGKAPSFDWDDVLTDANHDHWFPLFEAEVSRDGQLIGRYVFTSRVQLPPNVPHGRASHGVTR
jgi:hypothetical protein